MRVKGILRTLGGTLLIAGVGASFYYGVQLVSAPLPSATELAAYRAAATFTATLPPGDWNPDTLTAAWNAYQPEMTVGEYQIVFYGGPPATLVAYDGEGQGTAWLCPDETGNVPVSRKAC